MDFDTLLPYVSLALGLLSMVLHFVAPKTKTPIDDKFVEPVDKAKDFVDGMKR
jgi:hypothetical protein